MLFHTLLTASLLTLSALAAPVPGDDIPTPPICLASALTDRPTIALFHEAIRSMCFFLIPDDASDEHITPLNTTISFDFPQPDGQQLKKAVANIDFTGTARMWRGGCRMPFVAERPEDVFGEEIAWAPEIEAGNICMKEGEMDTEGPRVAENWVVLGWGLSKFTLEDGWLEAVVKFE
jgi:hypothetical protein